MNKDKITKWGIIILVIIVVAAIAVGFGVFDYFIATNDNIPFWIKYRWFSK